MSETGIVSEQVWPPRYFQMRCGTLSNRSCRFLHDGHEVGDRAFRIVRASPALSSSCAAVFPGRCSRTNSRVRVGDAVLAGLLHINFSIAGHPIISEIIVAFVGALLLLFLLRIFGFGRGGGK